MNLPNPPCMRQEWTKLSGDSFERWEATSRTSTAHSVFAQGGQRRSFPAYFKGGKTALCTYLPNIPVWGWFWRRKMPSPISVVHPVCKSDSRHLTRCAASSFAPETQDVQGVRTPSATFPPRGCIHPVQWHTQSGERELLFIRSNATGDRSVSETHSVTASSDSFPMNKNVLSYFVGPTTPRVGTKTGKLLGMRLHSARSPRSARPRTLNVRWAAT